MHTRLFVYGSLRKGFNSAAYEYMSNYFDYLADGKVRGLLYDLGEYPAAVPDDGDHFIIGELYQIRNEEELDWAMAQLDDYEGINPGDGEESLYRRALVEVESGERDEKTTAWIYWYDRKISGSPLVASGDVLDYLRHKTKQQP